MASRTSFLSTAFLLCHLLLFTPLVTSQVLQGTDTAWWLRAQEPSSPASKQAEQDAAVALRRGLGAPGAPEEVTIQAREQEKAGDIYTLRGDVEITFREFVLRAQQVTYNAATGDIAAQGQVFFDGGPHDEHIEASRAEYNVRSGTGKFHDVLGSTGVRMRGRNVVLTSSNPFTFTGKLVEKTGPDRYVVHHGSVTVCETPDPIWTFNARRVIVEVGDDATIYHTTFRIRGVPLIYLPYASHPIGRLGRQSGFLLPSIGTSSRKGTILGGSVYWAINRSMDVELGAEYYSRRGWSQSGEFRARPSETSALNLRYFGVIDRGFGPAQVDQGGQDIYLNYEHHLTPDMRAVANINYLSSFVFRLAFTESFTEAVNSEVKSVAFLSRTWEGVSLNARVARYQNFQSIQRGDLITIIHAPGFEASSVDQRVAGTRLHWSFDVALEGLSRSEPSFVTADVVGRLDVHPRVSLPLVLRGWSLRPEFALRNTYYSHRRVPNGGGIGLPENRSVNREAIEAAFELRPPALAKVFDGEVRGRKLKHTIETRMNYRIIEGVKNFPDIIRFDARDILSDTHEVEYSVTNRLFSKRGAPVCPPVEKTPAAAPDQGRAAASGEPEAEASAAGRAPEDCQGGEVREVVSWELTQKYFIDPNFGGALVAGKRNVFTTSAEFSGIAFLTEPRRFAPVVSKLRVNPTPATSVEWRLDYDTLKGRVNASTAFVNHRVGEFFWGGSHAFLQTPGEIFTNNPLPSPERFNQLRALFGYGHPAKRGLNVATNVGFDVNLKFLQYSSFQGTYNWNCCGVTFEYRRLALGSVRNENQFRFAFTLANIGTFGNLRKQERLF